MSKSLIFQLSSTKLLRNLCSSGFFSKPFIQLADGKICRMVESLLSQIVRQHFKLNNERILFSYKHVFSEFYLCTYGNLHVVNFVHAGLRIVVSSPRSFFNELFCS